MLNTSFHYHAGQLYCDAVPLNTIVDAVGTPAYIYSLKRILHNYEGLRSAFAPLNGQIHYSAKANANLRILKALIQAGAGIDCVSGGEIYKALHAGCLAEQIVFAGVGKTVDDLRYAVEQRIGWVNIENEAECEILNQLAALHQTSMNVALRFNPDVSANTIRQIATGHGGAKFGLSADAIQHILSRQSAYDHLRFSGIHVHIGSQLGDTEATVKAIKAARDLADPYPSIRTLDIGGGIPTAYRPGSALPDADAFARAIAPVAAGYQLILEPGRSLVADAGILIAQVLYRKAHAGQHFVILDTGMSELMRPALYDAYHEIVPLTEPATPETETVDIVGPVCETTDTIAHQRELPTLLPGDCVAILTTGAYGFVMANTYNARPRPPEVVVSPNGDSWQVARGRESWADLIRGEIV